MTNINESMIGKGEDRDLLEQLQAAIGTWAEVARACNVSPQAITYWRLRERVPESRKAEVKQLLDDLRLSRERAAAHIQ